MQSRRTVAITEWTIALGGLAAIVAVCHRLFAVNATTVALLLLLFILLVAARFQLRQAVVVSVAATAAWNFFFLPPIGTFTIADPQNWLALFTFLATSVIGSRLSQQARRDAAHARQREREVELLFSLSRALLQTDNVTQLVSTLPAMVHGVTGSSSVLLFLLEGDRLYHAGPQRVASGEPAHLRQLALGLPDVEARGAGGVHIPLREGVRPRGILVVSDLDVSEETYRVMGSVVSAALDRSQAVDDVARAEANRESERLRTLILDSITHELRTPLTAIKGAASALLTSPEIGGDDRQDLLAVIDEEADRLNRLVGQAVEMAQLESQEVRMSFAPVTLASLLAEARDGCGAVYATHPVTERLPPLPAVRADAEMVSKVLCNLLENAGKYSDPGSPIFISAERRGDTVRTSVADRGMGIDPAEQGFIFDRLYRARQSGQTTSGTGMGLAISRAIIAAHGGDLTVTSQPGHGSVFTFSLPVATSAE